jgi:uncharacterized phage-associated protein
MQSNNISIFAIDKQTTEMKTINEILKMRACVLYVAQSFDEGLDFIKLFKILYFAQREHLVKYGRGVIGDTFHALRFGPVPSFIYKALQIAQGKMKVEKDFESFLKGIEVNSSLIRTLEKPDMDELSESDIKSLDKYIKKYHNYKSYALSGISHNDKAWKQASKRAEDDPEKDIMTCIDIARAGNAKEGIIEYIKENIEIDKMLNRWEGLK